MKKEYIKPEIAVEEILVETMIATSSNVDPNNPQVPGESNSHRGDWGDLWN
jgi:hypothetical protein